MERPEREGHVDAAGDHRAVEVSTLGQGGRRHGAESIDEGVLGQRRPGDDVIPRVRIVRRWRAQRPIERGRGARRAVLGIGDAGRQALRRDRAIVRDGHGDGASRDRAADDRRTADRDHVAPRVDSVGRGDRDPHPRLVGRRVVADTALSHRDAECPARAWRGRRGSRGSERRR